MGYTTEKERIIFDSNLNQHLSSVLLNEYNYLSWSRAIKLALGSRSKLSFISDKNGVLDADSTEYPSWLAQDQLVISWLLNSMELKLSEIFSYSDLAYHLWRSVKDMYGEVNNSARLFQLKMDLA
ncbi:hypothetical protein C2S51_029377 [Perilla frutescens var. frutescens]|nr:hypothetical protein C2S51_029377 [Perilla frutescens var. frutescens]